MSQPVIKVEGLWKEYTIGAAPQRHARFYDLIADTLSAPLRRMRKLSGQAQASEQFWALRDINFEVQAGEVLGIIGRNGAGKSTLLKILSRITAPTKGKVSMHGRMASLLEVGTGFHPELTGRENVFLNGAILGMSNREIQRKLDEIIDFAGIEKFVDTPVKRYSSGMYVRLAFAVAAHLEPEILVLDEVLAVGDAQFQKKCLGKMESVSKQGRTVIFVSHQMAAIQRLCSRVMVLGEGSAKFVGETRSAIDFYLAQVEADVTKLDFSSFTRSGSGAATITSFSIENAHGAPLAAAQSGAPLTLKFGYKCHAGTMPKRASIGFSIHGVSGDTLVVLYSDYMGVTFDLDAEGTLKCQVSEFPFSVGRYYVGARLVADGVELDWPKEFVGAIDVEAGDFYGQGNFGNAGLGPMLLKGDWTTH